MKKEINKKFYRIIKKIDNGFGLDRLERHIILILEKDNKKYFYKELNNKDSSRFIEQIDFQKRVEGNGADIILPKLYDYDLKSEKKWGLWEYLEGKHLAEWQPKDIKDFEKWLEPIVDLLVELENIKPFKAEYNIADRMIQRIEEWSEESIKGGLLSSNDKDKTVNLIEKNRQKIVVGFNHADFVPWHMHEIKYPKFAIIDYENCKNKPQYYDLAYFYQRVYTKLNEPKLANDFLNLYKKKAKLPKDFEQKFLSVLAQRIIGGFYDYAVLKDKTDIKIHQELLKTLLQLIK